MRTCGVCVVTRFVFAFLLVGAVSVAGAEPTARLERVRYNHPGLAVDLGVGLYGFPLPVDWDRDGDWDLVVSCPDRPFNGTYLFLNDSGKGVAMPVFRPAGKLGPGLVEPTMSWVGGQPRVLSNRTEYPEFLTGNLLQKRAVYPKDRVAPIKRLRGNPWRFVDFDGDGISDLLVGHDSWDDFGYFDTNEWWRKYDAQGNYNGALTRGWVYWIRNTGSDAEPSWAEPRQLEAEGKPIETVGWPGPNLADFDGDGDLDLICGEFLDSFTWFENIGTRREPKYAPGRKLADDTGTIRMDLQMIFPQAVDWDGDQDIDLLVGDEDGRVAFLENTGHVVAHMPRFRRPRYFQQQAEFVKCGALSTPVGFDWDGDADVDLVSGNTAGQITFIENLSGPGVERPKFAPPVPLSAGSSDQQQEIRIQAGPNGSIQGPIEAKWGYTTQTIADWDHDGLPDIVANSIWGKVIWFRNVGSRQQPRLTAPQPIEVDWPGETPKPIWYWWRPQGKELVTQWRTTPCAVDWNRDGWIDLVMLDQEGYLAFFERTRRDGQVILLPPRRAFADQDGNPLRLNAGAGGRSGRRKLCVVDWDQDGKLDLLVNSKNANFLRQVSSADGVWRFQDQGPLAADNIEAHDVSPTTVDWNGDSIPDFIGGGEDGHFYYLKNEASGG